MRGALASLALQDCQAREEKRYDRDQALTGRGLELPSPWRPPRGPSRPRAAGVPLLPRHPGSWLLPLPLGAHSHTSSALRSHVPPVDFPRPPSLRWKPRTTAEPPAPCLCHPNCPLPCLVFTSLRNILRYQLSTNCVPFLFRLLLPALPLGYKCYGTGIFVFCL